MVGWFREQGRMREDNRKEQREGRETGRKRKTESGRARGRECKGIEEK